MGYYIYNNFYAFICTNNLFSIKKLLVLLL